MNNRVSLQRLTTYTPAEVSSALETLLKPLGGMSAFVRPGQKVLLKPNMLAGKDPAQAVTTHPAVVRAVIRQVQAAGGRVSLGDSPGIGSPETVARKCGLLAIVEETGAQFAHFEESVRISSPGGTFRELEIARDLLEADVIINLPKLKTHQMMGLTCAVKNMFGAVVGLRKPRLHLQAGADKAFFALMLLELCDRLSPALSIVDGIVAMEGNGPGSGDPVTVGALLAGASPLAVDTVATELVGFRPQQVWTQQQALNLRRPHARRDELEIVGTDLADMRLESFRPAETTDMDFGLPPFLKNRLTNSLTARPVPDQDKCQLCNACVTHCPPQAMRIIGQRLSIDYRRCIRCFCCQELCPHAALITKQGLLLRLSQFLRR